MTGARGIKGAGRWPALAGMGLAGGAGSALAVPISYVEGPDLGSIIPTALGALDVGVNTVMGGINCEESGGLRCESQDPPIDPSDTFGVTLPAGLKITSVTLNVSSFQADNARGRAQDFDSFLAVDFQQDFTANGLLNLFSGDAGGAGSLVFQASALVDTFPGLFSASYNYVWSITVESVETDQVPEPGTLALLGVTLAGLGWSRRKK